MNDISQLSSCSSKIFMWQVASNDTFVLEHMSHTTKYQWGTKNYSDMRDQSQSNVFIFFWHTKSLCLPDNPCDQNLDLNMLFFFLLPENTTMKIGEHEQIGVPMLSIYYFTNPVQGRAFAPLACKHEKIFDICRSLT